jgi:hypothetical protein
MKKQGWMAAAMILTAAALFAGNTVNFTGTWNLDESKAAPAGDMPRMNAKKIVVVQKSDSLSTDRYFSNPMMGDFNVTETVTMDGRECKSEAQFGTRITTATWSADTAAVLTLKSTLKMTWEGEEREMKSVEIWSLDKDGALKIKSTVDTPMGPMENTDSYLKAK